jgi:hypothetical protein
LRINFLPECFGESLFKLRILFSAHVIRRHFYDTSADSVYLDISYMAEESHHLLFRHTREAAQRFEYFLLGISVALCAFVGQTLKPEKLGCNTYSLQIASLVALIASVVSGFKRVEAMIATSGLNHEVLDRQAKRLRLLTGKPMFDTTTAQAPTDFQRNYTASELSAEIETLQKYLDMAMKGDRRSFCWQKCFLALGFGGLLAAKILEPYF